jgi:hypothetical protein
MRYIILFILVLNAFKGIVTIYINSKGDNHETLKENLYCKAWQTRKSMLYFQHFKL